MYINYDPVMTLTYFTGRSAYAVRGGDRGAGVRGERGREGGERGREVGREGEGSGERGEGSGERGGGKRGLDTPLSTPTVRVSVEGVKKLCIDFSNNQKLSYVKYHIYHYTDSVRSSYKTLKIELITIKL